MAKVAIYSGILANLIILGSLVALVVTNIKLLISVNDLKKELKKRPSKNDEQLIPYGITIKGLDAHNLLIVILI